MTKDIINQNEKSFNFLEERYFSLIEDLINKGSNTVYLIIQKARKDFLFKEDVYIYFFLNLLAKSKPEDCVGIFLKYDVFGLDLPLVNEIYNSFLDLLSDTDFMYVFQKNTKQKFQELNDKDIVISPRFYKKINFFVSATNLTDTDVQEILRKNEIKRKANALDDELNKKSQEDSQIFKI